jgi:alpha-glucosidase
MFPYFEQMRDAMRLRNALGPYIYSEARAFYDTGVAVVHPLYYDFPHDEALYGPGEAGGAATVADSEYAFGSAVLAAPITAMANVPNGTLNTPISRSVYLPSGSWSNWNGSAVTAGPATVTADYGVGDIPLFARAGALLPLKTMASVTGNFPDPLVWVAFPGAAAGVYTLYEDDGDSDAYQGGEFVTTAAAVAAAAGSLTLTVSAASVAGALPDGFPQARGHVLQVRGVAAAGRAVAGVTANGVAVPPGAGVPGWAVVAEAEHSLAAPAGALVVAAGAGFSSWSDLTVVVTWA